MTRNLETADRYAKLSLAALVVIFYVADVIKGPFARVLMILSLLILAISAVKMIIKK